ncbi:DUF1574 domain-containing protein [Coleofasciculus sp. FACHB-SPT9]|uniref:DUF1574 domain-containing protein n=1 Tax=Cyanophyceae TaxID=3028117 RepID=UPI0030DBA029
MRPPGYSVHASSSFHLLQVQGTFFVMLDADPIAYLEGQSSLAQWVSRAIGLPEVRLRFRLRGNNLHILCEGSECPPAGPVVSRFVEALKGKEGGAGFPPQDAPIDQVILYGRKLGIQRPDWIKQIHLERLELHQASDAAGVAAATPTDGQEMTAEQGATSDADGLRVSNRSLARSGQPEAIARYLSETLSPMGVGVKVVIQTLGREPGSRGAGQHQELSPASPAVSRRLWVLCDSNYSTDESLMAEPVAAQLRNLKLEGFRDAVICSQVRGEAAPDWRLRVDLTPPEEMLKDWARWGDIQAIARLLNQVLNAQEMQISAVLKDSTLHLFCSQKLFKQLKAAGDTVPATSDAAEIAIAAPDRKTATSAIAPVLESLTTQGIHAATIYGVETHGVTPVPEQETPIWIEWLNLPASRDPALAESTLELAQRGDLNAIQFLLQRLLNPDLDERLTTGGIRLSLRRKQDLLHIMSEALSSPQQSAVGSPVAKFLRGLAIPGIKGVRIYGRRAGHSTPLWQMGVDFTPRKRLVPEATPEFAASDVYLGDILSGSNEPVLRSDVTKEDLKAAASAVSFKVTRTIQQWLCASQLFIPTVEIKDLAPVASGKLSNSTYTYYQGFVVALVWGMLGFLLTVQTDWFLSAILKSKPPINQASAVSGKSTLDPREPIEDTSVPLPQMSLQKSRGSEAPVFNSEGFTRQGDITVRNEGEKSQRNAASAAILAAARSSNPSFNNRLLDEKVALYQQMLLQRRGVPPDVWIVGSSRAMRGVDPQALEEALAAQGYPGVQVFNFGINGATAQVVDLMVRQVLTPEQLPKLIIWADGARAFNSGRIDATYNAIANSQGYQHLLAGTFPKQNSTPGSPSQTTATPPAKTPATADKGASGSLTQSYQMVNNWLNETLGTFSATYPQRDQMKTRLRDLYVVWAKPAKTTSEGAGDNPQTLTSSQFAIDFDGFLPLTVRYNPATYYKQYARVSGDYDSDYYAFKMEGKQTQALESLLQFTQARQIPIVFINLPLTQDYLDPVRIEYEQEFQRYMRSQAIQKGLIFRDLNQLYPTQHDYFSDPSHLNRYGAYEVSNQLAEDPMIPWPAK